MGQIEAAIDLMGEKFQAYLRGEFELIPVAKETPKLLEFVSIVVIPATVGAFIAKERFVYDSTRVKIDYLGDNFTEWFLSGDGKTEEPIGETTLRFAKLRKASVDTSIIAELGGEEKSRTTLTEMFFLMEKQKTGDDGVLTNQLDNVFFIADQNNMLRTVDLRWSDRGWGIDACPIVFPFWLSTGYQVFSRKVTELSET
jgi:hypothetical protein